MSVFGVFLVRICPHSDWIGREMWSPNSVQIRENKNQRSSEYGHFSRGVFSLNKFLNKALINYHSILFIFSLIYSLICFCLNTGKEMYIVRLELLEAATRISTMCQYSLRWKEACKLFELNISGEVDIFQPGTHAQDGPCMSL